MVKSTKTNTKSGLWLGPKGSLIDWRWVYDTEKGKGAHLPFDVTSQAVQYLGEFIELEDTTTLKDIFSLLEANPIFSKIFERDFCSELQEEVAAGAASSKEEADWEKIEYLEVYRIFHHNSKTGELYGTERADLHGVGILLKDDVFEGEMLLHKKETRINWGLSLSSPVQFLNTPIKIKKEIVVYEENHKDKNYGKKLQTFKQTYLSLFNFLRAILFELSFHGAANERDSVLTHLKGTVEGIKNGTEKTVPWSDVKSDLISKSKNRLNNPNT